MNKLNLKYGEECFIYGTGTELDGVKVNVIGVSMRHIIDTYIVEFSDGKTRITVEDGVDQEYRALTLPESCLDRKMEGIYFLKGSVEIEEEHTLQPQNWGTAGLDH
jgi:hypothetical protein